ncbi:MAG: ABC transporter substrate-binding protein [Chloroflexi bacterium]|nr:ABC transporter substrate-binding protein [Chloroflexota bacterium]
MLHPENHLRREAARNRVYSRRQLFQLMAGGIGLSGIALLTACAQPAAAPTPAPAPTPRPAATTAPPPAAPAPTTAPAPTPAPAATTAPTAAPAVQPTPAQAAKVSKTLVVGMNIDDVISLDPHRALEVSYPIFDVASYETLLTFLDNDFKNPTPMLATSWEVSPDATVYTFKLRSGVKFASGNPMTSDDVKWSFERFINLKGTPAFLADPIQKVEAPDPQTVRFTLKAPDASFLAALAAPPLSVMDRKTAEAKGATAAADADKTDKAEQWLTSNSAGTGPYTLAQYTPKNQAVLRRNPNAWRPAKSFDEIVVKAVPESGTQKLMLERGEIDVAVNLLPEHIPALKSNRDVAVSSTPSTWVFYVGMTRDPAKHEALAKPDVARAIRAALDYEGFKALVPGAVQPASIVPTGFAGTLPAAEVPKMDLARAKELLAKAGYPNGFKAKLSVVTATNAGVKVTTLAEKVQADLGKVGIQVELEPMETGVWVQKWRPGDINLVIAWYYMDFPDASNYLGVFVPGGLITKGRTSWKTDTDIADLLKNAVATADTGKRLELYQQVQKQILDRGPYAALIEPPLFIAHRANVKGIVAQPMFFFTPQSASKD